MELQIQVATRRSLSEMQELVTRSEGIQNALWKEATTLADRPSASLSIFIQSLSELTDLQMKRVRAAVWNRIPPTIVLTLYGIAFLALTAMGYGAGLAESRTTVPSVMLILTFSAIIVLIVDLERPRQQLFAVSQQPMADVARRIESFRP
jgi:anti-sigma-K factor RskA